MKEEATMATGKFCPECGAKYPVGVPIYRCNKCGFVNNPMVGMTVAVAVF